MQKGVKYLIWLVAVALIGWQSIYFKKLSDVKALAAKAFDPATYALNFWQYKLPLAEAAAVNFDKLGKLLTTSPHKAFDEYGHALAIGSTRFFMIKGSGIVTQVTSDDVTLTTDSLHQSIRIATAYIYGNAVRDASGSIQINDFNNMLDLNDVASEIDKIIRKNVLPPFKANVKLGDRVAFTGALPLNETHLHPDDAEMIPVSLKIEK